MSRHVLDEKISLDDPDFYELFVETLTGNTFNLKVRPKDTVLDIKKKIQRVEGIPVHHQNLLYRLQELKDFNRICDLGIINGSTLKLVLSMRGGPISTRRLLSCDHHLLLKDLKELIDNTREEFGDKLNSGLKVSVLIFRDGDVINLIRVVENDEGIYDSLEKREQSSSLSLSLAPKVLSQSKENGQSYYKRIQENDAMSIKLSNLRKSMSRLGTKRRLKSEKLDEMPSIGCIGEEKSKEVIGVAVATSEPVGGNEGLEAVSLSSVRYRWLERFKKDAENLLKLHKSQFEDEEENTNDEEGEHGPDNGDLKNTLQICEDSIALKEKHRGKNNFYNVLFQNSPSSSDKPYRSQIVSPVGFSSKGFRERSNNFYLRRGNEHKNSSLEGASNNSAKSARGGRSFFNYTTTEERRKSVDDSFFSPFYNRFTSGRVNRNHDSKYETKMSLPDLSAPTPSTESVAIVSDDAKNNEKEVISPIGVVPFAGTVSMSKVPAHKGVRLTPLLLRERTDVPKIDAESSVPLDDNSGEFCDICKTADSSPSRSMQKREIGILKRWQSVDCSSSTEETCDSAPIGFKGNEEGGSNFEVVDREYFLPSLFPGNDSGVVPSHYASSKVEGSSDHFFGNQIKHEKISRCPLYRRCSQSGLFSVDSATCHGEFLDSAERPKTDVHHQLGSRLHIGPPHSILKEGKEEDRSISSNMSSVGLSQEKLPILTTQGGVVSSVTESVTKCGIKIVANQNKSKEMLERTSVATLRVCGEQVGSFITPSKISDLPAVITKKRLRCGACNKKLNITNMYDCRCGKIFCGQHRYSEVHGCNFDYKTHGRQLLERQNPLVIAEKLNKL